MSLVNRAIQDALKISTNKKEFGVDISLISLGATQTADVVGVHTKHANTIDKDSGMIVKGKNATCSIHELEILRANPAYPIRNEKGEVAMTGHRVSAADITGEIKHYVVLQNWPDETIGLITFVLGDYDSAA